MHFRWLAWAALFVSVWGQEAVKNAVSEALEQPPASSERYAKRVAIIGAGSAGASAAYYLQQYAANASIPVEITVFERESHIGGRSTTVFALDEPSLPVELGASIFVQVNRNLVSAVKAFNLSLEAFHSSDGRQRLGIWNGEEFVLVQQLSEKSWWESWWSNLKLLWKYGWAPVRTMNLMKDVVGRFLKMYDEPHFPWRDGLSRKVEELGLLGATTATGAQYLRENDIGDLFAREVIQASTRVNYAQNIGLIHGLETMVCMATDGAMAVQGGNWQIFAGMLKASKAEVRLETAVKELKKTELDSYDLFYHSVDSSEANAESKKSEDHDVVILTAPYSQSSISVEPSPEHIPDSIPYVSLHVTLFSSPHLLSPKAFNLDSTSSVPEVILTTLPPSEQDHLGHKHEGVGSPGFFSISILRSITNPRASPPRKEYVYKIFSPEIVNKTVIHRYLDVPSSASGGSAKVEAASIDEDITWYYHHVWNSYPYLPPRVTFPPQKLDTNLWYTSGIEPFISTMETSSLSGMNVARLIVDEWIEEDAMVAEAVAKSGGSFDHALDGWIDQILAGETGTDESDGEKREESPGKGEL